MSFPGNYAPAGSASAVSSIVWNIRWHVPTMAVTAVGLPFGILLSGWHIRHRMSSRDVHAQHYHGGFWCDGVSVLLGWHVLQHVRVAWMHHLSNWILLPRRKYRCGAFLCSHGPPRRCNAAVPPAQAQCPAGYYCTSSSVLVACPAGTYSTSVGATSAATCLSCPSTYYCPSASSTLVGLWSLSVSL